MISNSPFRLLLIACAVIVSLFLAGRWIGASRSPEPLQSTAPEPKRPTPQVDTSGLRPASKSSQARAHSESTLQPGPLDIPDELILRFKSEKAYRDFLANFSRDGVRIRGSIDALRAVRLSGKGLHALFKDRDDLEDGANTFLYNPRQPNIVGGGVQADAVPFGRELLDWLGIGDRPLTWGEGITVAVIDSGVEPHSTFSTPIAEVDLRANPSAEKGSHGTPVASLINGSHPAAEGIAPGAEILSYAITDQNGVTDAFTLAQAIVRAVDDGAIYVNISLGGGASGVLADAVAYANNAGSILVVSPGNEGADQISYPAAYPGVVSAGALDAKGDLMNFSNRNKNVSINAPGFSINAAFPDERVINFTGTSASAPVVTGVLAAVNSLNPEWTPRQTLNHVLQNSNDSGLAGPDATFGEHGEIAPFRAINSDTASITNIAISGIVNNPPESGFGGGNVTVVFENRGTESVANSLATVTGDGVNSSFSIPFLQPGQTESVNIPLSATVQNQVDGFSLSATITLANGEQDRQPRDNQRTFTHEPEAPMAP